MSELKKNYIMKTIVLVLAGVFIALAVTQKNSSNMTMRQKILKVLYPVIMKAGKSKDNIVENIDHKKSLVDFYSLKIRLNDNTDFSLSSVKGKKVILVNTASDCGFTAQYDELQKLYKEYGDKIVVIGFPANDFKQQEKKSDKEIASFCKINYGVTFPLAIKASVIKNEQQQEVFKWLTDKSLNGWNDKAPTWNFCKYVVDENGILTHFFASSVSPLGKEMKKALNIDQ
jgi:glutathione peroxidase